MAEEDSASLRSSNADNSSNVLVESISSAVADNVSNTDSLLTHDDVLRAIDKGGKDSASFDSNPATYWVGGKLPSSVYHKSTYAKVGLLNKDGAVV